MFNVAWVLRHVKLCANTHFVGILIMQLIDLERSLLTMMAWSFSMIYGPMSSSAQNPQYNVILSGWIEYSWISCGLISSHTQSIHPEIDVIPEDDFSMKISLRLNFSSVKSENARHLSSVSGLVCTFAGARDYVKLAKLWYSKGEVFVKTAKLTDLYFFFTLSRTVPMFSAVLAFCR